MEISTSNDVQQKYYQRGECLLRSLYPHAACLARNPESSLLVGDEAWCLDNP
jgi:hypothetical protein